MTRSRRIRNLVMGMAMMVMALGTALIGCQEKPPPPYGVEHPLSFPGPRRQIWAVAPVLNLSGENVDPILQADLLYEQLQSVEGLTVIPVNRVAAVLQSMRLEKLQSEEQARMLCDLLGADGVVVASITAYDPYDPPKVGAAIQLFRRGEGGSRVASSVDPHQMTRQPTLRTTAAPTTAPSMIQVVGMYDAQNGSVRAALDRYAQGRHDPQGPYGARQYFVDMDRYSGFVYHVLIADLLQSPKLRGGSHVPVVAASGD